MFAVAIRDLIGLNVQVVIGQHINALLNSGNSLEIDFFKKIRQGMGYFSVARS
jgi:hypothetical protein